MFVDITNLVNGVDEELQFKIFTNDTTDEYGILIPDNNNIKIVTALVVEKYGDNLSIDGRNPKIDAIDEHIVIYVPNTPEYNLEKYKGCEFERNGEIFIVNSERYKGTSYVSHFILRATKKGGEIFG